MLKAFAISLVALSSVTAFLTASFKENVLYVLTQLTYIVMDKNKRSKNLSRKQHMYRAYALMKYWSFYENEA